MQICMAISDSNKIISSITVRVDDAGKAEVGGRCDTRGRRKKRTHLPKVGKTSHKMFRNEGDFPVVDQM